MGSVHPEERAPARWSGIPGVGQGAPTPLPDGPESGEAFSESEVLTSFANASLSDGAFFGVAFDEGDGEEDQGLTHLHRSEQGSSAPDNDAMVATFGEVATIYLWPLQHFCVELCRGPVAAGRIAPLLPPLVTVIESARGMGLEQVAERFSSLQGYFNAIQQSGALSVEGTSREAVLRVLESLTEVLPGAFGTCATGDPLDGVILRTVLQLVPAITTHSLEQFFAAGFTSVEMLAGADPEEVTAITGLPLHLCEVCGRHAGDYRAERGQRVHLATPGDWLPVLEPRLGELERLQRAIERGKGDTDEERRRLRRERQRAVLQMELLLAEMGRVALLEDLQRQRLERRLERLREFVVELRRPSREELVQRLTTGQSLQHLDLRDQHLAGIQLPRADLAGSDLTGANLAGADLRGTRFIHASLRESFLQGADLDGAQLRHTHLEGADLSHARLVGADLSRACLEAARLEGANLEGACLRRVCATEASFAKVRLMGADLRGADLSGVDAGGADLRGADLGDATVAGTNFRGADLRGANLTGCDLSTARIEGARLEGDGGWEGAPVPSAGPGGGNGRCGASAAAERSAAVVLEAVSAAVGELKCAAPGERCPLDPDPTPGAEPTADREILSVTDLVVEFAPPPEADQSLVAEPAAAELATVPPPALEAESPVPVVGRPQSRSAFLLGHWAWAAAAAVLVLVVATVWFQGAPETPDVKPIVQSAPTTPPVLRTVAALPEPTVAPGAMEPKPQATPEPAVAEATVALGPAPEPVAAVARPVPQGPVPAKEAPAEMAEAASPQPVSATPVKRAKAVPVEVATVTPPRATKAAPVQIAEGTPAKKAKPSPAKPVKAAPDEKAQTLAPVEATPVKVAKAASQVVAAVAPPQAAVSAPAANPEALAVAFVDAGLEACVRTALGRPAGLLSAADVAGLAALNCSTPETGRADVTRLEGIESLVGLVTLDLSSNQITDIRPLARLSNLMSLNLRSNRIADIGPVATLPGACEIDLWQNPIGDITPLLMRSKR